MNTLITVVECWAAASFIIGPIWLALIHAQRIRFECRASKRIGLRRVR